MKNVNGMLNISKSQTGLAYLPDYAVYCTYYIKGYDIPAHTLWQNLAQQLDRACKEHGVFFKCGLIAHTFRQTGTSLTP